MDSYTTFLTNITDPSNMTNSTFALAFYPHVDIPNLLVLGFVILCGLLNVSIIVSFAVSAELRKPFNFIPLSMAVTDLLGLAVAVAAFRALLRRLAGSALALCVLLSLLRNLTLFNALLLHSAVAVMRVVTALQSRMIKITLRMMAVLIAVILLASVLLSVPFCVPASHSVLICVGQHIIRPDRHTYTVVMVALGVTCVTFVLMLTSYVTLGCTLKCRRNLNLVSGKMEILTARVGTITICLFVLCYIPHFLTYVINISSESQYHIVKVVDNLTLLQCAINPLVSILGNGDFRKTVYRSMRKCLCKGSVSENQVVPLTGTNNNTCLDTRTPSTRMYGIDTVQPAGVYGNNLVSPEQVSDSKILQPVRIYGKGKGRAQEGFSNVHQKERSGASKIYIIKPIHTWSC